MRLMLPSINEMAICRANTGFLSNTLLHSACNASANTSQNNTWVQPLHLCSEGTEQVLIRCTNSMVDSARMQRAMAGLSVFQLYLCCALPFCYSTPADSLIQDLKSVDLLLIELLCADLRPAFKLGSCTLLTPRCQSGNPACFSMQMDLQFMQSESRQCYA